MPRQSPAHSYRVLGVKRGASQFLSGLRVDSFVFDALKEHGAKADDGRPFEDRRLEVLGHPHAQLRQRDVVATHTIPHLAHMGEKAA